ncbi:MAG: murein biosynthesis integral membrane protein MurJ [Rhodospirillaceae bacterium]|nr:murein biosynthesis integral membrane protein MurJ [Rhodospirillaceae bacterium]
MALGRWVATVGGYTLGSRLLGFIRDILIAATLGAGPVSDAFFVAFKLPNFLRRLFAEGAFNAAFVPLFSGELEQNGRASAKAFAEEVLAVLLCVLLLMVVVAQIVMPWLMYALAPGFAEDPEKFDLTVQLTRITFPYILFISLVSLLGGVLNSLYRFAAAAATPIILNLTLIGALLGLSEVTETPGHALAIGVSAAGVLQFAWLIVALRRAGIALRLPRPRLTPRVKHMLILIAPAALGAGVAQVNLVVDVIIASLLPEGAVSFLYYADRINQLPLGVIGVAVGTALLPLLSRQLRAAQDEAAGQAQNRAIEGALLLTLPAAAALMIIAEPVISVLFERGAFSAVATAASADALIAYAAGLPSFVMIKVLVPGYFARQDTKTPVRIAIVCLTVNIAFNLILMGPLGHVGIALATTLSGWLNAALLARGLHQRGYFTADPRLRRRLPRMLLATLAMAAALWAVSAALSGPLGASLGTGVGSLLALMFTGIIVYGLAARAFGAAYVADIKGLWRSRDSDAGGEDSTA